MGNPAGVLRDFLALERRRLWAARLLKQGVHQSEAARQVGVHRQSVSRWGQQLKEAGLSGLKKAGRAGRKPRLSAEDLKKIEHGLKRGPETLGYENSLWTSWRVAHLIEEETGFAIMLRRHGAFCGSWGGAASVRWGAPWSGMQFRYRNVVRHLHVCSFRSQFLGHHDAAKYQNRNRYDLPPIFSPRIMRLSPGLVCPTLHL